MCGIELIRFLFGALLGLTLVGAIQFTIGNPFIWLDEKIRERRYQKWKKQEEKKNDNSFN